MNGHVHQPVLLMFTCLFNLGWRFLTLLQLTALFLLPVWHAAFSSGNNKQTELCQEPSFLILICLTVTIKNSRMIDD